MLWDNAPNKCKIKEISDKIGNSTYYNVEK